MNGSYEMRYRSPLAIVLSLLLLGTAPVWAVPQADLWSFWDASVASSQATVDHSRWQAFLDAFLQPGPDEINRVAYANVGPEDRDALNVYLQALAATDPRQLSKPEQFAYWVNLYNALTVEVVLRHPKKGSILRMGERVFSIGPWDDELITIAGQPVTLNDIEHRILRPIWRDHRIHYAVNCASLGCPNLASRAYTASNAEQLLAASEMAYINHPRGVAFDQRGRLTVSQIYKWYREDFAPDTMGLLDYLARHHQTFEASLRSHEGRVRYDYDWSLNRPE